MGKQKRKNRQVLSNLTDNGEDWHILCLGVGRIEFDCLTLKNGGLPCGSRRKQKPKKPKDKHHVPAYEKEEALSEASKKPRNQKK